jgi:hypothetical protein
MSAIHRYTVQGHTVNTPPFSCALSTESYMCGTLTEPAAVATVTEPFKEGESDCSVVLHFVCC